MIYDARRAQVVLFGGVAPASSGGGIEYPNDLWAWNGESWRTLPPPDGTPQPPGRDVPHLAYDAARERIVMFGGRRELPGQPVELLSDVWEWDGRRWYRIENSGVPKVIHGITAYDPVHRRIVLFGGYGDAGEAHTLWAFDGAKWQVLDATGPGNVSAGASAFTPAGDFILMTRHPVDDRAPVPPPASRTWTWNGTAWAPREMGPSSANLQASASTPDGTLYFYQSWDRWLSAPILRTRSAAGVWNTIETTTNPGMRSTEAAAYDAARGRFVLYGGRDANRQLLGDTWEFDGRDWTKKAPAAMPLHAPTASAASAPPRLARPGLVFDGRRQTVVLFGGSKDEGGSFGETWEWNGSTWRPRHLEGPSPRNSHGMVFDSRRGVIVMFGGFGDTLLGDTWEYDGTTWRRVSDSGRHGPAPRAAFGMAYDSARGRTVLFGGARDAPGQPPFTDTWEWDGIEWRQTATAGPAGNSFLKMVYDARRQRVVAFGGRGGGGETWEWDGHTWTRVSTLGPPPRDHHAMAYDSKRGRVIVFGGGRQLPDGTFSADAAGAWLRDLWSWDGKRWTQLAADGPPSRGGLPGLAYDAARDRLVLFGGGNLDGTWEWDGKKWTRNRS